MNTELDKATAILKLALGMAVTQPTKAPAMPTERIELPNDQERYELVGGKFYLQRSPDGSFSIERRHHADSIHSVGHLAADVAVEFASSMRPVSAAESGLREAAEYAVGMLDELMMFGGTPSDYTKIKNRLKQVIAQPTGNDGGKG